MGRQRICGVRHKQNKAPGEEIFPRWVQSCSALCQQPLHNIVTLAFLGAALLLFDENRRVWPSVPLILCVSNFHFISTQRKKRLPVRRKSRRSHVLGCHQVDERHAGSAVLCSAPVTAPSSREPNPSTKGFLKSELASLPQECPVGAQILTVMSMIQSGDSTD